MKKVFLVLSVVMLSACLSSDAKLKSSEYTIVDTTETATNGFDMVLGYNVILLNHYDSMYHAGYINTSGNLVEYNVKPIKLK